MHIVLLAVATCCFTTTTGTALQLEDGKPFMRKANLPAESWLKEDEGWVQPGERKDGELPSRVLEGDAPDAK